jgi:hypothetical protein
MTIEQLIEGWPLNIGRRGPSADQKRKNRSEAVGDAQDRKVDAAVRFLDAAV